MIACVFHHRCHWAKEEAHSNLQIDDDDDDEEKKNMNFTVISSFAAICCYLISISICEHTNTMYDDRCSMNTVHMRAKQGENFYREWNAKLDCNFFFFHFSFFFPSYLGLISVSMWISDHIINELWIHTVQFANQSNAFLVQLLSIYRQITLVIQIKITYARWHDIEVCNYLRGNIP